MSAANYRGTATGGGGFKPFAAGKKKYGGGRPMPTVGPVDKQGYKQRDAENKARREAILRRLKKHGR